MSPSWAPPGTPAPKPSAFSPATRASRSPVSSAARAERGRPSGSCTPTSRASTAPTSSRTPRATLLDGAPDAAILATPNEVSAELAPRLLKAGVRVIDVSGAFRLREASLYPAWYGFAHPAPALLGEAVYGLTEWCGERAGRRPSRRQPGLLPDLRPRRDQAHRGPSRAGPAAPRDLGERRLGRREEGRAGVLVLRAVGELQGLRGRLAPARARDAAGAGPPGRSRIHVRPAPAPRRAGNPLDDPRLVPMRRSPTPSSRTGSPRRTTAGRS